MRQRDVAATFNRSKLNSNTRPFILSIDIRFREREHDLLWPIELQILPVMLGQMIATLLNNLESTADPRIDRHVLHLAIGRRKQPLPHSRLVEPRVINRLRGR